MKEERGFTGIINQCPCSYYGGQVGLKTMDIVFMNMVRKQKDEMFNVIFWLLVASGSDGWFKLRLQLQ